MFHGADRFGFYICELLSGIRWIKIIVLLNIIIDNLGKCYFVFVNAAVLFEHRAHFKRKNADNQNNSDNYQ